MPPPSDCGTIGKASTPGMPPNICGPSSPTISGILRDRFSQSTTRRNEMPCDTTGYPITTK